MQVRLGTETGSGVVKATVLTLYSLLLAFGLSKALPLTCSVSKSSIDKVAALSTFLFESFIFLVLSLIFDIAYSFYVP